MKSTNYSTVGVDIRKLAALCNYFTNQGLPPKSLSELIRNCVSIAYNNLCSPGDKAYFSDVSSAMQYLMNKGYSVNQIAKDKVSQAEHLATINDTFNATMISFNDKDKEKRAKEISSLLFGTDEDGEK